MEPSLYMYVSVVYYFRFFMKIVKVKEEAKCFLALVDSLQLNLA